MKKLMTMLLVFLLCTTLFACSMQNGMQTEQTFVEKGSQREVASGEQKSAWTIFIYMCGTDLETSYGLATANLQEILQASSSDYVNIVLQTGGTKEWHTDAIKESAIQRFIVRDNKLELLEEQMLSSMGDEDTLYDFLSWGVANFPAEKTGVIFWNHGGGPISGAEFDELYGMDSLKLSEFKEAFNTLQQENVPKFEFVGFDACLMATIECANLFAPYARFLIASEEVESDVGWDYTTWVQYLADNPQASGDEVGKIICDSYYKKCIEHDIEYMATLSVIDLNKIPPLVTSLEEMSKEIEEKFYEADYFAEIVRGVRNTENYGGNTPSEGYTNQIDLGHFIENIADVLPDNAAESLLDDLNDAVSYKIKGSGREFSSGLSLYFPIEITAKQNELPEEYRSFSVSPSYVRFLENILLGRETFRAAQKEEGAEAYIDFAKLPTLDNNGSFLMSISEASLDNISKVDFSLYMKQEDQYLYLGSDYGVFIDWETGKIQHKSDMIWPKLNGNRVSFAILEETDKYILISIPIILNGERTNLRAYWVWDDPNVHTLPNGKFKVLGAWDGVNVNTGMASKMITPIVPGDEINPIYYVWKDNNKEERVGTAFKVNRNFSLDAQNLTPGEYWYTFDIHGVHGSIHPTDYASFVVNENGEVTRKDGV